MEGGGGGGGLYFEDNAFGTAWESIIICFTCFYILSLYQRILECLHPHYYQSSSPHLPSLSHTPTHRERKKHTKFLFPSLSLSFFLSFPFFLSYFCLPLTLVLKYVHFHLQLLDNTKTNTCTYTYTTNLLGEEEPGPAKQFASF